MNGELNTTKIRSCASPYPDVFAHMGCEVDGAQPVGVHGLHKVGPGLSHPQPVQQLVGWLPEHALPAELKSNQIRLPQLSNGYIRVRVRLACLPVPAADKPRRVHTPEKCDAFPR